MEPCAQQGALCLRLSPSPPPLSLRPLLLPSSFSRKIKINNRQPSPMSTISFEPGGGGGSPSAEMGKNLTRRLWVHWDYLLGPEQALTYKMHLLSGTTTITDAVTPPPLLSSGSHRGWSRGVTVLTISGDVPTKGSLGGRAAVCLPVCCPVDGRTEFQPLTPTSSSSSSSLFKNSKVIAKWEETKWPQPPQQLVLHHPQES